jgi:hypothetical protein
MEKKLKSFFSRLFIEILFGIIVGGGVGIGSGDGALFLGLSGKIRKFK